MELHYEPSHTDISDIWKFKSVVHWLRRNRDKLRGLDSYAQAQVLIELSSVQERLTFVEIPSLTSRASMLNDVSSLKS